MAVAFLSNKSKKSASSSCCRKMFDANLLFFIVLFTVPALFLLHISTTLCNTTTTTTIASGISAKPWSGDLRVAEFSWNRLSFDVDAPNSPPPLISLRIAVFTRKWPVGTVPGGMERHAHTLYTALSRRGHRVHIFTSPVSHTFTTGAPSKLLDAPLGPQLHFHEGEPGQWRYNKAWEQFEVENQVEAFDIIHSESVSLPHWIARGLPNLVASWHGIALESLQSDIYQDLALRQDNVSLTSEFTQSVQGVIPKILNEIRFFKSYAHHVAISDSCGEMLRDVYQIPTKRVHVILNGVDENDFGYDSLLGRDFRSKIGVPSNATLVLGAAGRLVRDKGHPLLFQAISNLIANHNGVYLIVAGSGPWEQRYRGLGQRVIVLGSLNPGMLRAFYNSIDLFVNPTLRPQGLDLTFMEAMMSGKPVMGSRFPSIKGTVVVEEEFGFMFSPNVESLVEVLEEAIAEGPVRMAQRGRACQRYASSMFAAKKMALAYERLFLCIKNDSFCMYH